jgi:hypothetical protein
MRLYTVGKLRIGNGVLPVFDPIEELHGTRQEQSKCPNYLLANYHQWPVVSS